MAGASQTMEDETEQRVAPVGDWFRKLAQQASLQENKIGICWQKLQEEGFTNVWDLRNAVKSKKWNGVRFDVADIDVPKKSRDNFEAVLLQKRLAFSHQEVRVSLALSRLVYGGTGPLDDTTDNFAQDYKPQLLQRACCPDTQQKYILAVVGDILFIAFAGTHQEGDWSTNMWLKLESAPEAGGSVHGGFRKRAMSVKFSAIHRLAVRYSCTKVIFTGHSLGGAVATLSCLFVLQMLRARFKAIRPCACCFAAPLVASAEVSKYVEKYGWSDHFVNFVNDKDPVPRLLNLTQTVPSMVRGSAEKLQRAAPLFEKLGTALGTYIPGLRAVPAVATGGVFLAKALEEAVRWMESTELQGSALDAFHPFGAHVFISDDLGFKILESVEEVLRELGPAELLSRNKTSLVAKDNVRRHDVVAYEASLKSPEGRAFLLEYGRCAENGSGSPKTSLEGAAAEQLKVEVEDVAVLSCESCLVYGVQGQNLDFIGTACVEINPGNVCDGWGRAGMEQPSITMIHENYLKIEQKRQGGTAGGAAGPAAAMPSASQVVMMRLCPDIGDPIEKPLRIEAGAESPASTEELSFDENLLRKILKHAWLKRHFHQDDSLLALLLELGQTVRAEMDKTGFLKKPPLWPFGQPGFDEKCFQEDVCREMDMEQALAKVGESEEIQNVCKLLVRWLCPSGGVKVQTRAQRLGSHACFAGNTFAVLQAASLAVSAVLVGGTPAGLGAYLMWTLVGYAALGADALFCWTQLRADYRQLLTNMLQGMGITYSSTPQMLGWSVSEMEAALVQQFDKRIEDGKKIFDHGNLANLTDTSVGSLSARIRVIGIINRMRRHVVRGLVSICGPQNHGKTTLVSQLLMLPEVSLKTGLDLQGRTRGVHPYQWGQCKTAFLLDSPGVDSGDSNLMRMFSKSGGLMGSAYVYIRLFNGAEQRDDGETIWSIMQDSSLARPHVLIVLNKISSSMRDAAQELRPKEELEGIRQEMKEDIITHRKPKHSGEEEEMPPPCSMGVGQMEESLLKSWRQRFANVEIVFAELGMSRQSIDAHQDLADIRGMVYTAKDIGRWLAKVLDPQGVDNSLKEAVNSIDYDDWAKLTREAKQKERDR